MHACTDTDKQMNYCNPRSLGLISALGSTFRVTYKGGEAFQAGYNLYVRSTNEEKIQQQQQQDLLPRLAELNLVAHAICSYSICKPQ